MQHSTSEPVRRSVRLKTHDYATHASYFVTICTAGRARIFGEIVDGRMELSDMGHMVRNEWRNTARLRRHVRLDSFIIMPDHVHAIVHIRRGTARCAPTTDHVPLFARRFGTGDSGSLSVVIGSFKSAVTRSLRRMGYDGDFWQRNYYEHIIRSDDVLWNIRDYIRLNPAKWDPDMPDY